MNNNDSRYPQDLSDKSLQKNLSFVFYLGVLLVLLGVIAIVFSYASTLLTIVSAGCFMVCVGIVHALQIYRIPKWKLWAFHLLLSLLYIGCGLFLIAYPVVNAVSLTFLLAAFFVVSGIVKLVFAFRSEQRHTSWLFFNGFVTLLAGVCIWIQLPFSGLWILGTLLGIEAMITGWTCIMLAYYGKNIPTT